MILCTNRVYRVAMMVLTSADLDSSLFLVLVVLPVLGEDIRH